MGGGSSAIKRVIVYSLDQLTRWIVHLQTLLHCFDEYGVELVVTNDRHSGTAAVSRLMTNIIVSAS